MHCSVRKSSGHFDPLILGWVSATQPTLHCRSSAQNEHLKSSYLFDNLKVKVGWTLCVQPTKGYNRNGAGRRDPHQDQVANFAPWCGPLRPVPSPLYPLAKGYNGGIMGITLYNCRLDTQCPAYFRVFKWSKLPLNFLSELYIQKMFTLFRI